MRNPVIVLSMSLTLAAALVTAEKLNFFQKTPQAIGLVLSDVNMPGKTGLEFLKEARGIADYATLPFILVTTESEKGSVIEAAVAGVSAYVVKPFNLETLSKRIGEAWKKHHPDSPT